MISVITPSYQQVDWLKLCHASVADQEKIEVEHIVQDAGTRGIESLRENSRLHLFVEKDAGMYDAANRGLRRARGEICAYLNCDEQYLPGALASVEYYFRLNPEVDVLFGDYILVDETGIPFSYRRAILPKAMHLKLAHLNTASCAMFFRRSIIERGFLFDPKWKAIGDAVWIHRLLEEKIPMAAMPVPLAIFTFTGSNLGATARSRTEQEEFRQDLRLPKLRAPLSVVAHRLQKFLAGAYRRRRVAISIYTKASPTERTLREATVGFGWPRNLSPSEN